MTYLAHLGVYICIFAILGTSLDLVMGRGGMFSIAHAAYYGIGAYATAQFELLFGWPVIPALIAGMLLAGLLGAITSLPALRLAGDYLIVASIATQIVCLTLFINLDSLTNGPAGLQNIPPPVLFGISLDTPQTFLAFAIVCLVLVLAFQALLMRRPWGRLLRGARDDAVAIGSLGKNVRVVKVSAYVISAAVAGLAGGLYADFITFISPDTFALHQSVLILTIVIVGGTSSLVGSVVGAAVVVLLPEALRLLPMTYAAEASIELFAYGALLVAFVLFQPKGILGIVEGAAAAIRRRGAQPVGSQSAEPQPRPPAAASPAVPRVPRPPAPVDRPPVVELRGVSKSFGGIRALNGVSLSIEPGRVTGILGPNGAGKTTVLDVIGGYITPDEGEVLIGGEPTRGLAPYQVARRGVVRVFQEARTFPEMTLRENVITAFPRQPREKLRNLFNFGPGVRAQEAENWRRAGELLARVGLEAKAEELAGALSYGQQKLVTVVRALAADPKVMLLDEPSVGLALPMIDTMCQFVEGLVDDGRTIVIVEHNLDVMRRLADRLIFMHDGQVGTVGATEEVLGDRELGRMYFGLER